MAADYLSSQWLKYALACVENFVNEDSPTTYSRQKCLETLHYTLIVKAHGPSTTDKALITWWMTLRPITSKEQQDRKRRSNVSMGCGELPKSLHDMPPGGILEEIECDYAVLADAARLKLLRLSKLKAAAHMQAVGARSSTPAILLSHVLRCSHGCRQPEPSPDPEEYGGNLGQATRHVSRPRTRTQTRTLTLKP